MCDCTSPCSCSNSCAECTPPSCKDTFLSECVVYSGQDFSCLNVLTSTNLNTVLGQIITQVCALSATTWSNLTLTAGVTTNGTITGTPQYTKNGTGWVTLRGTVDCTLAGGDHLITTLPSGFRPPAIISFPATLVYSAANQAGYITIQTNGDVTIKSNGGNNAATLIHLSHISFNVA